MTLADLVYIEKGLASARPAAGAVPGKRRGWFATDTGVLSITDGSSWIDIGGPGVGGVVDSVFGRTGAVAAATSDYDADQIDFTPAGTISATDVQAAIEEVAAEAGSLAVTDGSTTVSPAMSLDFTSGATVTDGGGGIAEVAISPTGGGVDSIAKSGDTPLTGDMTLSEGANVTLTQSGNDIAIASTGGGAVSVVTSLPGSPSDGDAILLRCGSSPYEFVFLVYDGTYGKWISAPQWVLMNIVSTYTSTATSYTTVSDANVRRAHIANYKALYDAGLRLQVFNEGQINTNNSGATGFIGIALAEYDVNDTTVSQLGSTVGGEISNLGTAAKYKASGWVDFNPAAPTKAHAVLIAQVKVSANTGTFSGPNAGYRLVG